MLKKHKLSLILSSIVTLLPLVIGLLLWDNLPETMPMHWNAAGEVDGWGTRDQVVFMMPCIFLGVHLLCVILTVLDPKRKNIDSKIMGLVLWLSPFLSLLVSAMTYATALGYEFSVNMILPLGMGFLFVIIGNFLPKCKRNYTVGIKISWTLNDEANWNATHRFAGWVWTIGGIVIMVTSLLDTIWIMLSITLILALAPVIYSFLYYRKHEKSE